MPRKILRVDASMRKNNSYSRKLADSLVEQLNKNEQYLIKERDLADGVSFIDEGWINASFTDINERTNEQCSVLLQSDTMVNEVLNADVIIIGLPIYNFSFPAAFKAWIDQVVRANVTFRYSDSDPIGLLKDKKAYVMITSGGTQMGSDIDFFSPYLRYILAFIGIKDLTFIDSSGIGSDEENILSSAYETIAAI